jgi:quercetin dioxygenase-like cupin family protein
MKRAFFVVMLVSIAVFAQNTTTAPSEQGRFRKQIFKNDRVTVYSVEIPAGQSTAKHTHDHDVLAVYISGGTTKSTTDNQATVNNKYASGDVRYRPAPFSHTVQNTGNSPFRVVDIEFADAQGLQEKPALKKSHYCNPGSKEACVTEEYLFCTPKFCVEDVTMGPGAMSSKHTHDTEHMLVGITDYTLDDDTMGKGVTHRAVKSGGVEYLPAGITHVLTNTSKSTVRFIAIIFK